MLRNYLIIAIRNLLRHKSFSFINIFGLAIGMAACLLILQYVSFELSYDEFHQNKSQIYRVRNDKGFGGKYQRNRLPHCHRLVGVCPGGSFSTGDCAIDRVFPGYKGCVG